MTRPKGYKQLADCTREERAAVEAYYVDCHPSNLPSNRETAWWRFTRNIKTGELIAGFYVGYIL